jgi:mutual gliding-motility protein MglA
MLINHASKQVTAKVVYYGPGLSGKTTNLQHIFSVTNPRSRGELVSMETEIERTLFFDLLPMNVGLVKGYQTRFQLYTVPGQVFYDSTRKLVLKGADGIVFVADSQELMEQANRESFENLKENLAYYKKKIDDVPLVLQYNKRDLKNISSLETLNGLLNGARRPYFEAVARSGRGVLETLREISTFTLVKIHEALEQTDSLPANTTVSFDTDTGPEEGKRSHLSQRKITIEKTEAPSISKGLLSDEPLHPVALDAGAGPEPVRAPGSAAVPPPPKADRKPVEEKNDFLSRFEDESRMTRIEKIHLRDNRLQVEIRDHDGHVIKVLQLELKPQTKKVNLILDVKH